MLDDSCLDFRSRETMARYIDDVINSATNPVVAFMITTGTITGELVLLVAA